MAAKKLKGEFEIEVLQSDIDRGVQEEPEYCMVARAARRATRKRDVIVNGDSIKIAGKKWNLSPWIGARIDAFDEDKKTVKPFKFKLRCEDAFEAGD